MAEGRTHESDAGFTLVELLVVIVIIGIISAVVIFAVGGSVSHAQEVGCRGELKQLETAVEAYNAAQGFPPVVIDDLTVDGTGHFLREVPAWYDLVGGTITVNAAGSAKNCPAPS